MTTTIAVTEPEFAKGRTVFEQPCGQGVACVCVPYEEAALADAIARHDAQHVILGVEKYAAALYEALPRGGVLARYGVGYDGLDLAAATRYGLLCTNTPGVLDESTAEHAVALMLAAARHVPRLDRNTRGGTWVQCLGGELAGKRLAVIGCGAIGRRVARIASLGLEMQVVACKTSRTEEELLKERFGVGEVTTDFSQAVAGADYVSLHIPSIPETRHFLGADRLAEIPAGAWLVNTARGAVVDEVAMFDAIQSGRLGGAALDVFEIEPYSPIASGKDLRTLDNVIFTPHVASNTVEACRRMAERSMENIMLATAGRFEEMDLLNPEVLDHA